MAKGNHGDGFFAYRLYDTRRKMFAKVPDFAGIDRVDTDEGTPIDEQSGGVAYWNVSTYRLGNGSLELIREVVAAYAGNVRDVIPVSYSGGIIVRITRIYNCGRLARTLYSRRFPGTPGFPYASYVRSQ